MFRVLYGVRDSDVRPVEQPITMFSHASTSTSSATTSEPPPKNDTHRPLTFNNAAAVRFPGFAIHQKTTPEQIEVQNEDVWINLNIGGCIYSTTVGTLQKYPATRLNKLAEDNKAIDGKPAEYKFDRNASMFSFILDYMRSGELHVPSSTCIPYFRRELEFWGIEDDMIAPCCWPRYKSFDEEHEMLEKVRKHFLTDLDKYKLHLSTLPSDAYLESCRWKTWVLLEYPYSSLTAKLWAALYVLFVLISIFCLVVDTHEDFRIDGSSDRLRNTGEKNRKILLRDTTDPHPAVSYLDLLTTLIFSVEILLRFCVCPNKKAFFTSFLTWTDLFSLLAQWIIFGLSTADVQYWDSYSLWRLFEACSVVRVFRVFRIFRLAKHYTGLQILVLALQASATELIFLAMFVMVGMLIFATFIFYAEFKTEDVFLSIPESFWWAIITMTTVGYGDAAPVTGWGYFVGSVCALCGIVTIGLPIPIIATNFKIFYDYANLTQRMKSKDSFDFQNISLSKLKGKMFSFRSNKRNGGDINKGGKGERTSSKSSIDSKSSKRSLNSKISKVHPTKDQTQPVANIPLERYDSEERNDLISSNKSELVRSQTTRLYPKQATNQLNENECPIEENNLPLLSINNLNQTDNNNTNNNCAQEKSQNEDRDDLRPDKPTDPKQVDNVHNYLKKTEENTQKPFRPTPASRSSSLHSLVSPLSDPLTHDPYPHAAFSPPGYSPNPALSHGLPRVEGPTNDRSPLPQIQRKHPPTSKSKKPKKKVGKKRKGFMMF